MPAVGRLVLRRPAGEGSGVGPAKRAALVDGADGGGLMKGCPLREW